MEIAAVTAAVAVIVWVVLWHLFVSTNRLSISTTLGGRLLSVVAIVAIARVVEVDAGLIPTTGPQVVVIRVTKMIVIHEVLSRMEEGDGALCGEGCLIVIEFNSCSGHVLDCEFSQKISRYPFSKINHAAPITPKSSSPFSPILLPCPSNPALLSPFSIEIFHEHILMPSNEHHKWLKKRHWPAVHGVMTHPDRDVDLLVRK